MPDFDPAACTSEHLRGNLTELRFRAWYGVPYAEHPSAPELQVLHIFIPEEYFCGGSKNGYTVTTENGTFTAQKLVIAWGGVSSPQISAAKNRQKLCQCLKLESTGLFPALTQIKTAEKLPKDFTKLPKQNRYFSGQF